MSFLDAIAGPILLLPVVGIFILIAAVFSLVVLTMIIIALIQRFAEKKKKENTDE